MFSKLQGQKAMINKPSFIVVWNVHSDDNNLLVAWKPGLIHMKTEEHQNYTLTSFIPIQLLIIIITPFDSWATDLASQSVTHGETWGTWEDQLQIWMTPALSRKF